MQKIQYLLGYFLSSLSHMYSCQRIGYVHRIKEEAVRVQMLLGTNQDSPTDKRKSKIKKTNQHNECHNRSGINLFSVHYSQLRSRCETIIRPFSDTGSSLNPLFRKLRNKQQEIEKKKKEQKTNILQPFMRRPQSHFDIVKHWPTFHLTSSSHIR